MGGGHGEGCFNAASREIKAHSELRPRPAICGRPMAVPSRSPNVRTTTGQWTPAAAECATQRPRSHPGRRWRRRCAESCAADRLLFIKALLLPAICVQYLVPWVGPKYVHHAEKAHQAESMSHVQMRHRASQLDAQHRAVFLDQDDGQGSILDYEQRFRVQSFGRRRHSLELNPPSGLLWVSRFLRGRRIHRLTSNSSTT